MRARKNETTAKVLRALADRQGTAQDLAARLGANVPRISMTLLKLIRSGHATRTSVINGKITVDKDEGIERPRYFFFYSITEKGLSRLKTIKVGVPTNRPTGRR